MLPPSPPRPRQPAAEAAWLWLVRGSSVAQVCCLGCVPSVWRAGGVPESKAALVTCLSGLPENLGDRKTLSGVNYLWKLLKQTGFRQPLAAAPLVASVTPETCRGAVVCLLSLMFYLDYPPTPNSTPPLRFELAATCLMFFHSQSPSFRFLKFSCKLLT